MILEVAYGEVSKVADRYIGILNSMLERRSELEIAERREGGERSKPGR